MKRIVFIVLVIVLSSINAFAQNKVSTSVFIGENDARGVGITYQRKVDAGVTIWPTISLRSRSSKQEWDYGYCQHTRFLLHRSSEHNYSINSLEFGLDVEVFSWKRFTGIVGGRANLNQITSDIDYKLRFIRDDFILTDVWSSSDSYEVAGAAFEAGLDYELSEKVSIGFRARYDWLVFVDSLRVPNCSTSPPGGRACYKDFELDASEWSGVFQISVDF